MSHEIFSYSAGSESEHVRPIRLVASIESAQAVMNLKDIARWRSEHGPLHGGRLSGLLVRSLNVRFPTNETSET